MPAQQDDIVDQIEQRQTMLRHDHVGDDRDIYRQALIGFDPHLQDACEQTLEQGANALRGLFPFQKPLFRRDGSIPANIGRYRIAHDGDHTHALLFGFDPEDLKEPDLSKDVPPGRLERLHVVHACQSLSPAQWAYPEIIKHQQALQDRALNEYTLYQTGPDVWRSDQVGYVLYPVDRGNRNGGASRAAGEMRYALWMFSDTSNAGEFTRVREQPPASMLAAGLTLGANLGEFSREEAIKAMRQDFAGRVRRSAEGRDPVSAQDKLRNPLWLAVRGWQRTRNYFANTKPAAIALDGLITVVNMLDGPIGFVQNKLVDLASYVRDRYADGRPLVVTDQLARVKRTARGFDPVLRDVDPKAVAGYRLLDAAASRAVPLGETVIDTIDETFSQRRMLSIMSGTDGAIVRLRHNGIISLRHANGVKVDHAPDGQTSYVRYDPNGAVESCRALRPREAALFEGDRVLKICRQGCDDEFSYLSGADFLKEVQTIQDDFVARKTARRRERERVTGPDANGLRARYTGDPKSPIRWQRVERLKAAANQALGSETSADAAACPLPQPPTATARRTP